MKETILKLRGEGKTYMQIKAEVGCAVSTVSYYCGEGQKEKTIKRNKKRIKNRKEIIQKFFDKYENEEDLIVICKEFLEKNGYKIEKEIA